ncbi:MAG: N-acetylmuramoyl-L-alanine amidase [Hyphomonadaceae bacterium]|jgi:N-acetylmuramoyl-L-alanine amidase|nr:N-acetylmuramoyl-L-alanine amidase [Hyphomonadaceae bacterium]
MPDRKPEDHRTPFEQSDAPLAGPAHPRLPLIRILVLIACIIGFVVFVAQVFVRDGASAQTAGNVAATATEAAPGGPRRQDAAGGTGIPAAASATRLTVNADGEATVIEIALNRAVPYRIFALSNPTRRLVIDTARVDFNFRDASSGRASGAGAVGGVRFAQKSQTESRFVLDLAQPVTVTSHTLDNRLGGRVLRITLAPATPEAFAALPLISEGRMPQATQAAPARGADPRGPARKARYVIVIDAGHGGRDPGALNQAQDFYEKQATLASALVLRDYLRRDRRFDIVMTRSTDVYLTLEQRITIARDRRADLFISLHADAAPPEARVNGATVYTLSEEGSQRSRRLLNNDNWRIVPESVADDREVADILNDLTRRDTTNQSALFAQTLLTGLGEVGPLTRSSHRVAGFFVLLSPTVPAVLLEMGFMTNLEDEARLRDPQFRDRQMRATANAIIRYFDARPGSAGAAPVGSK